MWFSTSALVAVCLAASALGKEKPVLEKPKIKASASTDENGIRSIALRTHSLSAPYLDSDMQSRWFDFGGNTIIRVDQYIRLTSDRPSQEGWIFSRVPLTATNWEIEVEFKLHGSGNLHGDGMAMWLTKQRATPGPVFGSTDRFEGLGIFIDTYKNNRPGTVFPYVMSMVGDGTKTYDKANDGKDNEFMGCSARGLRGAGIPTKLKLTYFQDTSLKLELQYRNEDQWELCFESNDPPAIPSVAYLGFSSETGELSDNHDIISITTKNLYDTKNRADTTIPRGGSGNRGASKDRMDRSRREGGSWSWFFFKILMFIVVLGGGYAGYTAWRTHQRKSHRF